MQINVAFPELSQVLEQILEVQQQILTDQRTFFMSTVQDLHTEFVAYVAARDAIDVAKDAASAAKDAAVADATQKLADAATKAGVDAQTIADLQAGVDAAVAEEAAELAKLTPPVVPTPPADGTVDPAQPA